MPSIAGHSLAGLTVFLTFSREAKTCPGLWDDRYRVVAFMALANLADLDLLVGFLVWGDPFRIHQGISHGIPLAALAAAALALAWPAMGSRGWSFLGMFAATVSHPLLDLLSSPRGPGWYSSTGVGLLAPILPQRVLLPFAVFPGVHHRTLSQLVSAYNVWVVVYECAVFSCLIALVMYLRRPRRER